MIVLILAYAIMGVFFFVCQKQGQTFLASVNKVFEWGSCLLVIGCCVNIVELIG